MGQIREYGPPKVGVSGPVQNRKLETSDISIGPGLEALGRGVAGAQDAAFDINNHIKGQQETKEISDTSVKLSDLQAKYSQKWQERLKTGNQDEENPEMFLNDYLAEYDQESEALGGELKTDGAKQFFKEHTSKLRTNLTENALQSEAQLTGEKIKNDFTKVLNNNSATLVTDPTTFEFSKGQVDALVDTYVRTNKLDTTKAEELRQVAGKQLATSAVKGMARINPEAAQYELDSGKWDAYIDGGTKDALYGEIRTETRAKRVESERVQTQQKEALKQAQSVAEDQLLEAQVNGNLNSRMVLDSVIAPERKQHYLSLIKRTSDERLKASLKPNPAVVMNAFERINMLPDGDPRKIKNEDDLNRLFAKGGMSVENLSFLRKELRKNQTEEGKRESTLKASAMNMAKATIIQGPGPKDPKGAELYLGFQQEYWKAYDKGIKEGKSVAELTDPDFVKGIMRPFIRPPQVRLQDKAVQAMKFKAKAGGSTPEKKMNRIDEILKKRGLGNG